MYRALLLSLFFLSVTVLFSQDFVLPLYPEGIPCENDLVQEVREVGSTGRRIMKVHEPQLAVYLAPENLATGASVVICPGGGYTVLAWDWEGSWMAEWFNSFGINAFVLKYRLPHWESETCHDKVALMDAQRAIRTVRANAGRWHLDPDRIGIMGFSAGGHLASTASTHFDGGKPGADLEVDRVSCRPDFSILMYPVISMDTSIAHMGSRTNLIGKNPTGEMQMYYSNEKQVSSETPPTILIHASDDRGVIPENSLVYYQALIRNKVPAALHIYESGGHGFSFARGKGSVEQWPETVKIWMGNLGLLKKRIKVLIIDGQNNHTNWKETTEIMKNQLQNSGLFSVDIARTSSKEEGKMSEFKPDFSEYDVVVSNYNGESWPEATRKDFEDFVRSGHGFVSVHAADNAFADWPAYNEMIGLGGWEGRTEKDGPYVYYDDNGELIRDEKPGPGGHHGKQHAFMIEVRDTAHPITFELPRKWMHATDELYDQLRGPARNMNVLATAYSDPDTGGTGRHEPMLMAIHYGLGRVFHTALGHLNESREHIGFEVTFLRGVEWAATGSVTQVVPKAMLGN
ncbi:MAG: ThuA domain-containing protein [Saprospiraceae bacterium]|nr:ThuA domain-containing protein [Saprospiraceae bacterium]